MDLSAVFGLTIIASLFEVSDTDSYDSDSQNPWPTQWSYRGHTGPKYWSLLKSDWSICSSGKYQSPININPRDLLFDPTLRRVSIERPLTIHGTLINTGSDITLDVDDSMYSSLNISNGPFIYHYRLAKIKLHFGRDDAKGSEHTIDGLPFSAEMQMIAYNTDIYSSYEEAKQSPYGIAILTVFAEIGRPVNDAFKTMATFSKRILWKGQSTRVETLPAKALFPNTNYYVTYDGSFTQPGCYETVTWLIYNRPVYISKDLLFILRRLQKGVRDNPDNMVADNFRPLVPVNNRVVRTNINSVGMSARSMCGMNRYSFYQINPSLDV